MTDVIGYQPSQHVSLLTFEAVGMMENDNINHLESQQIGFTPIWMKEKDKASH